MGHWPRGTFWRACLSWLTLANASPRTDSPGRPLSLRPHSEIVRPGLQDRLLPNHCGLSSFGIPALPCREGEDG